MCNKLHFFTGYFMLSKHSAGFHCNISEAHTKSNVDHTNTVNTQIISMMSSYSLKYSDIVTCTCIQCSFMLCFNSGGMVGERGGISPSLPYVLCTVKMP